MNDDAKSATAWGYDVLSSSYNQIVPFFTYFVHALVPSGRPDRHFTRTRIRRLRVSLICAPQLLASRTPHWAI